MREDDEDVLSLGGIWLREGRTVGGGVRDEPADVAWLQAGRYFADVRTPRGAGSTHPLDQAQGFSGWITVEGAAVTWWHDLDTTTRPSDHRDTAMIERRGEQLIERGPGYEEEWRLAPAAGSLRAVLEARPEAAAGFETSEHRHGGHTDAEHPDVEHPDGVDGDRQDGPVEARVVVIGDLAAAVWRTGGAVLGLADGWAVGRSVHDARGVVPILTALEHLHHEVPLPPSWRRLV